MNSTIKEAVSSNVQPVKTTIKHPADPDNVSIEAVNLLPKKAKENRALKQAMVKRKKACKTVKIKQKNRRRRAKEKAAATSVSAPSGTAPHAGKNRIYGFAKTAVSLDSKPLLSPG